MKDLLKEENQKYNEYDDCGCLLYDVTQNVYQGEVVLFVMHLLALVTFIK